MALFLPLSDIDPIARRIKKINVELVLPGNLAGILDGAYHRHGRRGFRVT